MSKELADRMEKVASDLLRDGMLDNAESKIIDEAIAALRSEPVAGQLSAEKLCDCKVKIADCHDAHNCRVMSLSSLRGTEQDADELLREVLDWGLPDDLK